MGLGERRVPAAHLRGREGHERGGTEAREDVAIEEVAVELDGAHGELRTTREPVRGVGGEGHPARLRVDPGAPVDVGLDDREVGERVGLRREGLRRQVEVALVPVARLLATRRPAANGPKVATCHALLLSARRSYRGAVALDPLVADVGATVLAPALQPRARARRPRRRWRYDGGVQLTAALTHEGDWYVARCLDVEVTSQGHSVEEALANLREALELYFEDVAPPENLEPPIIATIRIPA